MQNSPAHRPSGEFPDYTPGQSFTWSGDQVVLEELCAIWFQGGPDGTVVWCFSTKAVDVEDIFTDPEIRRETIVVDE